MIFYIFQFLNKFKDFDDDLVLKIYNKLENLIINKDKLLNETIIS